MLSVAIVFSVAMSLLVRGLTYVFSNEEHVLDESADNEERVIVKEY